MFLLFIAAIISFYVLYLVIKAAIQSGTNDLLQEMKKLNGNKDPNDFPVSTSTIATDPEIIKIQKANKQKQIIIMLIVFVVIIVAVIVFS